MNEKKIIRRKCVITNRRIFSSFNGGGDVVDLNQMKSCAVPHFADECNTLPMVEKKKKN